MWYRKGTVQVTNSSSVITGTNTEFVSGVRIGDGIVIDGKVYEITNVASNTLISVTPVFEGTSGANKKYAVIPVLGYDKDLSDSFNRIRLQLEGYLGKLDDLNEWVFEPTREAILAAERSQQDADRAEVAREGVEYYASSAETSETNAKASELAAKESETNAALSASSAETSETNAKASELAAKESETNAALSASSAETSETNAKTSELAAQYYASIIEGASGSVFVLEAGNDIPAGAFVQITNGLVHPATDTITDGFVIKETLSGSSAEVSVLGSMHSNLTGLIPGSDYWLLNGQPSSTPPTSGIIQKIGTAVSASRLLTISPFRITIRP